MLEQISRCRRHSRLFGSGSVSDYPTYQDLTQVRDIKRRGDPNSMRFEERENKTEVRNRGKILPNEEPCEQVSARISHHSGPLCL